MRSALVTSTAASTASRSWVAAEMAAGIGGKVGLKLAVKKAGGFEMGLEFSAIIQDVTVRLPAGHMRQLHVGFHLPLGAQEQSRQEFGKLQTVADS